MADETIRITVDDESSKGKDDSVGQEIVSQADTSSKAEAPGVLEENLADFERAAGLGDFEADVSGLDALIEERRLQEQQVLESLIGTTEEIGALGTDLGGFSDTLITPIEELDNLGTVGGELAENLDTLNASFGEVTSSTEELQDGYSDLIKAMSRSATEWDKVAEELVGNTKKIGKAGLQTARQTANLARAAGLIGSNANQIVAAGTALANKLPLAGKAAVALAVAIAATILAFKSLDKAAESLAKEIGGFSGETAVAQAEKRILELEDRIRLADERGSQAAEFIEATSDLNSEVREFKRDILAVFLPIATFIAESLTSILQAINTYFGPLFELVGLILTHMKKDLLLGPIGALAKRIEELIFGVDTPDTNDINQDLIDLFDPKNVGFDRDASGKAQEKAAQDRFDQMLNPPVLPP